MELTHDAKVFLEPVALEKLLDADLNTVGDLLQPFPAGLLLHLGSGRSDVFIHIGVTPSCKIGFPQAGAWGNVIR